ncbi:MAG: hypothetical protein A2X49_00895 [Lentisphaerae bacterium GWF2_52_8]|nr:MAG: hypothetical protein A2X49_00895 [Lentisphaerae bacterium GWF2_52_8]
MKSVLVIMFIAVTSTTFAGDWKNDAPASGNYDEYFSPCSNATITENGGKKFLVLPSGGALVVKTHQMKANPLTRYRLSFEAYVDGPHVVEAVPMYHQLFFETSRNKGAKGQALPLWSIVFRDKEGKPIPVGYDPFFNTIMSKTLRPYSEEFRTPPNTETLEISFFNPNKEDSLFITALKITEVKSPETANINPDFSLGADNYSGINILAHGKLVPDPERPDKYFLDFTQSKGCGARGDFIPVTPGETYRVEYKFSRSPKLDEGIARLIIFFYNSFSQRADCQSGELSRIFTAGKQMVQGEYSFVVPQEMHFMRTYMECGRFEYVRIIKESNTEEKTDTQK